MTWTATEGSHIFRAFVADVLGNTVAFDLDLNADTPKVALYGNTGTPDRNVASNLTQYNTGQWVTGNELANGTDWVAAGRPLAAGRTLGVGTNNIVNYSAPNLTGAATTTLANVMGCLVYDDTLTTPLADQGICFNFFGGAQSVTSGTFSVNWNASGIFNITV